MTFRDAQLEELQGTPWLDGPVGEGLIGVIADANDVDAQELKDAVRMRDAALAPVDAYPYLADDRYLLRAPIETNSAFVQRLTGSAPLDYWEVAGTAAGYVNVFAPYGFDASTVQFLSNHEVGGNWDGNAKHFSRVFGFLDSTSGYFYTDGLWSDVDSDAGLWAEDDSPAAQTWDSSATVADIQYFRAAIRLTKGDGAYPVAIAVWLNNDFGGGLADGYWDSPGLYDDGSLWTEGDGLEQPLYWTLGNVWGQEAWTGDGVDAWEDGDADELVDLEEQQLWIAFPGEE